MSHVLRESSLRSILESAWRGRPTTLEQQPSSLSRKEEPMPWRPQPPDLLLRLNRGWLQGVFVSVVVQQGLFRDRAEPEGGGLQVVVFPYGSFVVVGEQVDAGDHLVVLVLEGPQEVPALLQVLGFLDDTAIQHTHRVAEDQQVEPLTALLHQSLPDVQALVETSLPHVLPRLYSFFTQVLLKGALQVLHLHPLLLQQLSPRRRLYSLSLQVLEHRQIFRELSVCRWPVNMIYEQTNKGSQLCQSLRYMTYSNWLDSILQLINKMVQIGESVYEEFLLSADKQAFVAGLMKGSQEEVFFSLMLSLQKEKSEQRFQEQDQLLARLKHSFPGKKDLLNMVLLNRLALEQDPKKVKDLLALFNKQNLHIHFSQSSQQHYEEGHLPHQQIRRNLPSTLSQKEKDRMCALSPEDFSLESLDSLTREGLDSLEPGLIFQMALDKPDRNSRRQLQKFLQKRRSLFKVADLPALAAKAYHSLYHDLDLDQFIKGMNMNQWSLPQLEHIQQLIEPLQSEHGFVMDIMVRKKFSLVDRDESQDDKVIREEIETMRQTVAYLQNIPNKIFQEEILEMQRSIMEQTRHLQEYDFDLFFELLDQKKEKEKKEENKYVKYPSNQKYMKAHIKQILREGKQIDRLEKYFGKDQLRKVQTRVKLLQGDKVENAEEVLSKEGLERLVQKKKLVIRPRRQNLDPEEKVTVWVRVKNIKTVEVKVFQLNSEEYYLKKMAEIDGGLNLDGLVANYTQSFEFGHPACQQHLHEFSLGAPCLDRPGVFLVEVLGGGLSSRTLFQKGSLFILPRTTLTGQQVQLYDHRGPISPQQDRLGLYLDREFISADDRGVVRLPFQKSPSTKEVVVVHNNLASLCSLTLAQEDYEFNNNFLYNSEALVENNVADFVLQPSLLLRTGQELIPVSFQLVSKMEVSISQKDESDISTLKKVEVSKESLLASQKEGTDLVVPVQIVKGVKNIHLEVVCSLAPLSQEPTCKRASHSISINNQTDSAYDQTFCGQFLQVNKEGAKVFLLGKSGEPKEGVTLSVMLVGKYHKDPRPEEYSSELRTDDKGAVHLGSMEGVRYVYSVVKEGRVKADSRKWTLLPQHPLLDYQDSIVLLQNENITLPFQGESVSLFQLKNGDFLKDCSQNCSLSRDQIEIDGLSKGEYTLEIGVKRISVEVVDGHYLEEKKVIQQEKQLLRLQRNNQAYQGLKSVHLSREGQHLCLQTNRPGVKVHLLAFTFLDKEVKTLLDSFSKRQHSSSLYDLPLHPNSTFNAKQLSDELVYVLDRKDQPRYIGNYLSKPQVLLNRQFNEDTKVEKEILKDECEYANKCLKSKKCDQRFCKMTGGGGGGFGRMNCNRFMNVPGQGQQDSLRFLGSRAVMLSNLKSDASGKVVVEEALLEKQQCVMAVILDKNQVWVSQLGLEEREVESRWLGQQGGQEGSYVSTRLTAALPKGDSLTFQDIQGTEFQLLDSLSELSQVHSLLRPNSLDKDWDFLLRWQALSLEQKHRHYSKQASHELHLFLFFKDRPYFDLFIRPFLLNKFAKTFLDHWLLQDASHLEPYVQRPALLKSLQQHEVLLLLHFVVHHEPLLPYAVSLASYVKANARPLDPRAFNRLFDQVMKSKVNELSPQPKQVLRAAPPQQMFAQQRIQPNSLFGAAPQSNTLFGAASNTLFGVAPQMSHNRDTRRDEGEEEEFGMCMQMEEEFCDDEEECSEQSLQQYRDNYRAGRQEVDRTKEYIERNYLFKDGHFEQDDKFSEFLVAYSEHLVKNPESAFLNAFCVASNQNMGQRIVAMALTDLPFSSETPELRQEEGKMSLRSQSHLLVFYKQFQLGSTQLKPDILVSQRFFDPLDQFREEEGLRVEKEVQEYVVDRVYGCQVAVTNCSVAEQLLQVIFQLPHQALPVASLQYTQQVNRVFPSFTTQTFSFFFYFPRAGLFQLQPASVNRQGMTVAVAGGRGFQVKEEYSKVDTTSLTHVLSQGTPEQVLAFLQETNLHDPSKFSPSSIPHLLHQPAFFQQLVQIMQKQHYSCPEVLAYSILHGDKTLFFQLVAEQVRQQTLFQEVPFYQHPAFLVDHFSLKEYFPVINSRAHPLRSAQKNILNVQLRNQYFCFVKYLCFKNTPSADDRIVLAYYLLLQERVQESILMFQAIPHQSVTCHLQYDYLQAYLDFYTAAPDFPKARAISNAHLDHPVLHWRQKFQEIAELLAEYDGEKVCGEEKGEEGKREEEEQVSLKIEGDQMQIRHSSTGRLQLFFYKVDLEVLFSINPFMLSDNSEQENFMLLLPNHQVSLECGPQGVTTLRIPEEFRQDNLQLLVKDKAKVASATYFPNQMEVVLQHSQGELRVLHASRGTPLPKVYIKCFVKTKGGRAQFFKDGYTDLVGRFDYSQSTSDQVQLSDIAQYFILVASDDHGCVLKQAGPTHSNALFQPALSAKVQGLFQSAIAKQQALYESRHN